MKNIYFVRHGEAEGNAPKTSQTPTTPLTAKGLEQAKVVADRVQDLQPEILFASPFMRAQQTAYVIAEALSRTVTTLDSVHEWQKPSSLGGVAHGDPAHKKFKEARIAHESDPDWRYEDEETFTELVARCEETYRTLLAAKEDTIVVVSHGQFIKIFSMYVLLKETFVSTLFSNVLDNFLVPENTGIVQFIAVDDRLQLAVYNDRAHFAE